MSLEHPDTNNNYPFSFKAGGGAESVYAKTDPANFKAFGDLELKDKDAEDVAVDIKQRLRKVLADKAMDMSPVDSTENDVSFFHIPRKPTLPNFKAPDANIPQSPKDEQALDYGDGEKKYFDF